MADKLNIYQMYIENGCRFGFYVTRDSWSDNKFAEVIGIGGVTEGEMIQGTSPYFNRLYPADHPKAGKVWQREIVLKAEWLTGGRFEGSTGGTYVWTRVYPQPSSP